jgi:hypothetical protein
LITTTEIYTRDYGIDLLSQQQAVGDSIVVEDSVGSPISAMISCWVSILPTFSIPNR